MVSGGDETATLARDTVFAAVMITCNGIVGLSLLVGALRHGTAVFNAEGTGDRAGHGDDAGRRSAWSLPTFTTSSPGPEFSPSQLAFAAVASLALYGLFVFVQTVRHRDYFLPVGREPRATPSSRTSTPTPPSPRGAAQPRPAAASRWSPSSASPRSSRRPIEDGGRSDGAPAVGRSAS